jgi:hypothetical protein
MHALLVERADALMAAPRTAQRRPSWRLTAVIEATSVSGGRTKNTRRNLAARLQFGNFSPQKVDVLARISRHAARVQVIPSGRNS